MGKTSEKQTKITEDKGQKYIDALENLKPEEQTKMTEDKSNDKSKASITFSDLINKTRKIMSELHDSID